MSIFEREYMGEWAPKDDAFEMVYMAYRRYLSNTERLEGGPAAQRIFKETVGYLKDRTDPGTFRRAKDAAVDDHMRALREAGL